MYKDNKANIEVLKLISVPYNKRCISSDTTIELADQSCSFRTKMIRISFIYYGAFE